MDEQALQRDVLQAFEYAHNQEDWVTPVTDALAGVTAEDALWRPTPDAKGIWDIVLHMAVWTENCVERMQSGGQGRPAEGPWPSLPATGDMAAWDEAQQRLWRALAALRAQIEETPPAALLDCTIGSADQRWSPLDEVLCRLFHNAYHVGQITKLRECLPEREATA